MLTLKRRIANRMGTRFAYPPRQTLCKFRLVGLWLIAGCWWPLALNAAAPKKPADDNPKGTLLSGKSPQGELDYWYYIPAGYTGKKKVPLVLSYHGAGGTGQAEIGGWKKLAEQYGFIVACPTSEFAGAGHQAGVPMAFKPEEAEQEVIGALSIVKFLKEKYAIDPRRVLVTGFSGGGNPTYFLSFTHPEVFPFACPRCGNFPSTLQHLSALPENKATFEQAAQKSHFYIFYGEKDHPIILGSIDATLNWVNSLHPAHCKIEKVPGLGHSSSPDKAAKWFADEQKEAEKDWELEAKAEYDKILAAGRVALEQKATAEALRQFGAARDLETDYPKLGRAAGDEWHKLDVEARRQWDTLRPTLKQDADTPSALAAFIEQYPGTEAATTAAKQLEDLKQKAEHDKLLAAGRAALEQKATAEALCQFGAARKMETDCLKLGQAGGVAWRSLEMDARQRWDAIRLPVKQDAEALAAWTAFIEQYPGTEAAANAAKKRDELEKKLASKEAAK